MKGHHAFLLCAFHNDLCGHHPMHVCCVLSMRCMGPGTREMVETGLSDGSDLTESSRSSKVGCRLSTALHTSHDLAAGSIKAMQEMLRG